MRSFHHGPVRDDALAFLRTPILITAFYGTLFGVLRWETVDERGTFAFFSSVLVATVITVVIRSLEMSETLARYRALQVARIVHAMGGSERVGLLAVRYAYYLACELGMDLEPGQCHVGDGIRLDGFDRHLAVAKQYCLISTWYARSEEVVALSHKDALAMAAPASIGDTAFWRLCYQLDVGDLMIMAHAVYHERRCKGRCDIASHAALADCTLFWREIEKRFGANAPRAVEKTLH